MQDDKHGYSGLICKPVCACAYLNINKFVYLSIIKYKNNSHSEQKIAALNKLNKTNIMMAVGRVSNMIPTCLVKNHLFQATKHSSCWFSVEHCIIPLLRQVRLSRLVYTKNK